ncbi:MAG: hypothetical protein CM15mP23_08870 [Cryomorphaceae bacterium]|nr:MAG: hypothetical protein CM15mP23_08870 [Cryomorphaceae bacterium]
METVYQEMRYNQHVRFIRRGGGSVTVGGVTATNSGFFFSNFCCVDLSACNTVDYEATVSWP